MALVVVQQEDTESILSTVSHEFDQQWDSATVNGASELIRTLANSLSGVFSGQLLFISEDGTGLILFATWWPWDNGINISLRIGMFWLEGAFDREKEKEHLTAWFAL